MSKRKIMDVFNILKKFLSVPRNLIITITSIAFVVILIILLFPKKNNKFVLNEEFDVFPKEVRMLYANMVDASCMGDLYFNLKSSDGIVGIEKMDTKVLLNYVFSYLDKNDSLKDKNLVNEIKKAEEKLFENDLNLISKFNSFEYKGNVYNFTSKKDSVVQGNCKNDEISYVTFLCGYFSTKSNLYMDVDIGYVKSGILYSLDDRKLGEYDGDISKLESLMKTASYYRFGYKKHNRNDYRLLSVELRDRA